MADIWVVPAATGGNDDGTNQANGFLKTQSAADTVTSSDRILLVGIETLSVPVDFDTTNGGSPGLIEVIGLNSSGVEDGTMFVLDGNSAATNCIVINKNRYVFRNIETKNATGDGVKFNAGAIHLTLRNCHSHNNGASGYNCNSVTDPVLFLQSTSDGNTLHGWGQMLGVRTIFCMSKNNGGVAFHKPRTGACIIGSIGHNSTLDGAQSDQSTPVLIMHSIFDDNGGDGIDLNFGFVHWLFLNRVTSNGGDGIRIGSSGNGIENWNFSKSNTGIQINGLGDLIQLGDSLTAGTIGYTNQAANDFDLTTAATLRRTAIQIGI